MSKLQIQTEAMQLFAQHGYEGTSMQFVAEAVGIKKQSIYTHYKNKDALFLGACEKAMEEELAEAKQVLAKIGKISDLQHYLHFMVMQYETSARAQFWARMSIYPPVHLQEQVMASVYIYLDALEQEVAHILAQNVAQLNPLVSVASAASAFLGVVDACLLELLYGGPQRVEKRLQASWEIYERGVLV